MPRTFHPCQKPSSISFSEFLEPALDAMNAMPELKSRGNRPLKMSFEEHLRALVFFHLEEHTSAQHLLQTLKEDDFAREHIAPDDGIEKSSFSEATNSRGLEQFLHVFENLQEQASHLLPHTHKELGQLVGIDGSLIDGTLSMLWADYRKGSKKAKVHVGFDLNRSIPRKVHLTDGNSAERPFVSQILSKGQTGVLDRGYQCHELFDQWQQTDQLFICRIKASTKKDIITQHVTPDEGIIFFDAMVLLGTAGVNQSQRPLRLVGYEIDRVKCAIETFAVEVGHRHTLRGLYNVSNCNVGWLAGHPSSFVRHFNEGEGVTTGVHGFQHGTADHAVRYRGGQSRVLGGGFLGRVGAGRLEKK